MNKKIALLALASVVAAPMAAGLTVNKAKAASLTDIVVTPASTAVSTSTDVTITFTPVTAVSNNTVLEFSYDSSFTGGASLTDADIAITGTGISAKSCSGFTADFFSCVLTTTGTTTTITTVIGGTNKLTTPATPGNYNWTLVADIGGTDTTYDSGAGLAYIANENRVNVTATVPSVLALDLYNAGTTTLMSDPNTCALGVLSFTRTNTCSYNVGVGTNNASGARLEVAAEAAFTNGSYTFANATGAITPGDEAYGFYISANGDTFTPSGSYGSAYQAVPVGAVNTATVFALSTTTSDKATLASHLTVEHAATMSTDTETGNYTQAVRYFAYTR